MPVSGRATVDGFLVSSSSPTNLVDTNEHNTRVVIHNRLGVLYVKLGKECSSIDHTYRINKDAILEITDYTGPITAVTASGAGFVDVSSWG
jgi:uncharacterized radical SAM superfamily protein